MAARVNKIRHDDETRAKIRTSQLINRLTDHAFGDVELSQTQVRSIEILLKKTLPDLSSVEMSGDMTLRHEDWIAKLRERRTGNQGGSGE